MTSHNNSTVAHGSTNGPWSESANPHTESGLSGALHENLNPKREIDGESERVGLGRVHQADNTRMSWPPSRPHQVPGESPSQPTQKRVGWLGHPSQQGKRAHGTTRRATTPLPQPPGGRSSRSILLLHRVARCRNWIKALGKGKNTFQNFSPGNE